MTIKQLPEEKLDKLHDALKTMGRDCVKKPYKDKWTPERPSTGYCYVVVEVFLRYCAPKGSKSYVMDTGDKEKHWFIKTPNGEVIDPTIDQFDETPDYSKGKHQNLRPFSKRARKLAKLLGLPELREMKKSRN